MTEEIIIMGSINQDVFITTNEFPNYGDTVWVNSISNQPGGKGANQAIALSRIGSKVKFIGAIGNDDHGKNMLNNLKNNDIDISNIQIMEGTNTGTFIVVLDENGQNTMLGTLGANSKMGLNNITKIFSSTTSKYFLLQLETSKESILHALKLAKNKGITVVLDPAPADGYDEYYLSYADIITPNQQEAEKISGIKIEDEQSALTAAQIIREKGVKTVIVKLGEQGSLIYDNGNINFVPAYKVKVINTVGAGDVFAAALTSHLNKSNSLVDSVKFATAASAIKVSEKETQKAIPTEEEINYFIEQHNY